jgi:hypothetical protein
MRGRLPKARAPHNSPSVHRLLDDVLGGRGTDIGAGGVYTAPRRFRSGAKGSMIGSMHVRVCRDCGEEYQPTTATCSDCGGALVDRFLDESGNWIPDAAEAAPATAPSSTPQDLRPVVRGALSDEIAALTTRLAQAGIPFVVGGSAMGFDLLVADAQFDTARETLAPLLPPPPAHDEAACPACGRALTAGTIECPECGLAIGEPESIQCVRCGGEMAPGEAACSRCAENA